ncbi:hypothetical protein J2Z31_005226 [Sinorhizobium kostiense]|uniref:DUF1127 domain-containing protein n=1 Tax=Sinorhizobium kostiense TaxID=76747 RepID=A0ABS4R711_9HYPH|nr:hypothetical protein [Sinorhizobium kostiense]
MRFALTIWFHSPWLSVDVLPSATNRRLASMGLTSTDSLTASEWLVVDDR